MSKKCCNKTSSKKCVFLFLNWILSFHITVIFLIYKQKKTFFNLWLITARNFECYKEFFNNSNFFERKFWNSLKKYPVIFPAIFLWKFCQKSRKLIDALLRYDFYRYSSIGKDFLKIGVKVVVVLFCHPGEISVNLRYIKTWVRIKTNCKNKKAFR